VREWSQILWELLNVYSAMLIKVQLVQVVDDKSRNFAPLTVFKSSARDAQRVSRKLLLPFYLRKLYRSINNRYIMLTKLLVKNYHRNA
jgi:hypothetical protein